MTERFRAVCLSYRTSTLEVRELLSFNDEENRQLLVQLKEVLGLEDALIISTCNRSEIYYVSEKDLSREVMSLACFQKRIDRKLVDQAFRVLEGEEAVRHLYEVALGLDAKVLGDIQISNQVKRAYQCSADEGLAGPLLHRIMHSIFYANKRVVQETAFRDGAASTSYASVSLTRQFITNFKNPKILVMGLGEIGKDIADNLHGIEAEVFLTNRSFDKACEMAEILGATAIPLVEALEKMSEFNVVISSVAVNHPILHKHHFTVKTLTQKLLIDLSVPRSVSNDLSQDDQFLLYNIDQIEEQTSSILEARKAAIPQVKAILEESMAELSEWSKEMEVSPVIKKLKQALENIRQEEMKRYLKKADQAEAELVNKVTKSLVQKVLKLPVLQLKAACKRGEADTLVDVLNDLFDLERQKVDQSNS
jgi:glutamyl-tRNA reductase